MTNSLKTLRTGLLAATAAGALALSVTGTAHAGAIAMSIVDVQSLYLVDSGGTRIDGSGIFTVSGGGYQSQNVANFDGVPGGPNSAISAFGGAADATHVCVGPDCNLGANVPFAENDYAPGALVPGGNFSYSDSRITGTPFTTSGRGVTDQTRADVQITENSHEGNNTTSTAGGGTSLVLATGASGGTGLRFRISGNVTIYVALDMSDGGDSAFAGGSWVLDISETNSGPNALNFSLFNNSRIVTSDGVQMINFHTSDFCNETNGGGGTAAGFVYDATEGLCYRESAAFDLAADTTYDLSISHTSQTSARFVPEPATLALLGCGLLGLGGLRRRLAKG